MSKKLRAPIENSTVAQFAKICFTLSLGSILKQQSLTPTNTTDRRHQHIEICGAETSLTEESTAETFNCAACSVFDSASDHEACWKIVGEFLLATELATSTLVSFAIVLRMIEGA